MKKTVTKIATTLMVIMLCSPVFAGSIDDLFSVQAKVTLKNNPLITGHQIMLSDIFDGISEKENRSVAIAPAAGGEITLDARQLYRIARACGLEWRPVSMQTQITIVRDSIVIRREEVETEIIVSLYEKGVDKDSEIVFNHRSIEFHAPSESIVEINASNIVIDGTRRRFAGTAEILADGRSIGRSRISGQIFPVTNVPVVKNALSGGNVIKEGDIEWINVRADQIRPNTILEANKLVGMETKRSLKSGAPIQANDINRPVIVAKGQIVSMVITTNNMSLTARGEALENGSVGDFIKILNTRSNKSIQGRVSSDGRIIVENTSFTNLAMN